MSEQADQVYHPSLAKAVFPVVWALFTGTVVALLYSQSNATVISAVLSMPSYHIQRQFFFASASASAFASASAPVRP